MYFTKLNQSSPEVKALIEAYLTRADQRIQEDQLAQTARKTALTKLVHEIFTTPKYRKVREDLEKLLALPEGHKQPASKIFGENSTNLTNYFTAKRYTTIDSWNQWNNAVQEQEKIEREENNDLVDLCSNQKLLDAYIEIIRQPNYWLRSEEMELVALVYDLNLQLFHCPQRKVDLSHHYNPTGKTQRVVFLERGINGGGSHYWRCEEGPSQVKPHSKISSYADLSKLLLCYKPHETVRLLNELLSFVLKLEQVIQIYLEPQIFSIQLLAHPIIEEMLKKNIIESSLEKIDSVTAPADMRTYHDCKKIFEAYGSNRLGEFLSDPLDNHIHSKSLEMYYFTNKEKKDGKTIPNTLCINVKGFSFKEFSFKRSVFHNFDFTQTYFEGCDFSDVTFSGVITFSGTYMDAKTAKTFFLALQRALFIGVDLKIKGVKGIILVSLKDRDKNETQSIPRELSDYIETKSSNWLTAETYLPTFEKPTSQKSSSSTTRTSQKNNTNDPAQDSPEPPPTSYVDSVWGGLGAAIHMGANVTSSVLGGTYAAFFGNVAAEGLESFYAAEPKSHAEDVLESNKDEIAESKKLEIELEKLRNEISSKISSFQINQDEVNTLLANEQRDVLSAIEEQQSLVNNMNEYLSKLEKERRVKVQISKEQKSLLKRKDQVTAFYQTFLTELCFSLQAILTLQNNLKLIDPSHGRATKISNKQEKCGSLLGAVKKDPSKLAIATQYIKAGKDHLLGIADLIKPALPVLAGNAQNFLNLAASTVTVLGAVTPLIGPVIDFFVKSNDRDKLDQSKEVFRGLTTKTLEKMADAIARKITFAFEEQIQLLSYEGAIGFAECGVLRIIAALFNGYLDPSEDFVSQAWRAICSLKTDHNYTLVGIEIPFLNRKLQSIKNKDSYFTEDELFRLPGVAYKDKEGRKCCFSNDAVYPENKSPFPDSPVTKAKEIGYMNVSKEEWEAYFRHCVTLDDDHLEESSPQLKVKSVKSESLPVIDHLQGKIMEQMAEMMKRLEESEKKEVESEKKNKELQERLDKLEQKK